MNYYAWLFACCCASATASVPDIEHLLNQPLAQVPDNIAISGRFSQSSATTPGPVYIVTAEQISTQQLRNLSDILRLFPGLHVMQDSHFTYLNSRGIGQPGDFNARLLFLIDGARINENTQGAGLLGEEFFLDTNVIDRVEYYPGAPSASFGTNAMLGVVHVITKQSADLKGLRTSATFSNQGHKKAQLTISSGSSADFEGWFSASFTDRDGIPILSDQSLGLDRNLNTEHVRKISSKLQWRSTSFLLSGVARNRTSPLTAQNFEYPTSVVDDQNKNYMLSFRHDQSFSAELTGYFTLGTFQQKFTRNQPYWYENDAFTLLESELSGRWSTLDARLHWQPGPTLSWWTGMNILRDHRQIDRIALPEFEFTQNLQDQNLQLGVYSEIRWQLHTTLSTQLGIRYDQDDHELRHFSPQAALMWQPWPELQLNLRHGRSSRAPSFIERIYNDGIDIERPQAESIHSTDLLLRYKVNEQLHLFANLYQARLKNLIYEPYPLPYFVNAIPVKSKGAESGFELRWKTIRWQLAASLQRSELNEHGRLNNSPARLIKSQLEWYFHPDWQLHWQVYGVSERLYDEVILPGYVLHQLGIQWHPTAQFELAFSLKNATNKDALEIPSIFYEMFVQQPRTLSLQLQWRFW